MRNISPGRTGTAVGVVFGFWHLMWVSLVAIGWAKPIMDFILKLHFIQLEYDLAPFALGTAVELVALTFCVGAFLGVVFALVWNRLTGTKSSAGDLGHRTARA